MPEERGGPENGAGTLDEKRRAALRRRAEALLRPERERLGREETSEARQLIHELDVFQTELELQNDELRRSELDLISARDRFQELFDSAPVGYLTIDRDGVMQRANQTAGTMLGVPSPNLLGVKLSTFVHTEDQDVLYLHLRQLSSEDRSNQPWHSGAAAWPSCEVRLSNPEADWLPVQVDSRLVLDGPEAGSFRTALTDIAGRKQTEEALKETVAQLRKTQDQVVQQERLRAVGQMASGAAHDLNNALSPVLGYAQLLGEDPSLSSRAREWVELIRVGASDAAEVVSGLHEFYGDQSTGLPKARIDVRELMSQIPLLTRPKWHDEARKTGREVVVETDLQEVPMIGGVEAELRQVLTNLVFNAVDALPSGGRITLRTYGRDGQVCVEVVDDGVGMTEGEQRHCFEPFFSNKAGGSGLGLSVCYGIVRRHGGRIEVESQPARGALFRITFPTLDPSEDDETVVEPEDVALPSRRILYIDDDARVRPLVADLLDHLGQVVTLAEDGESGLNLVETGEFDAVITDLGMSGVDGRQVVRTVRERHPGLPVVMLTGWSEDIALQDVPEGLRPTAFLQKPTSLAKLSGVLRRVFDRGREGDSG